MVFRGKREKIYGVFIGMGVLCVVSYFFFVSQKESVWANEYVKRVKVIDGGIELSFSQTASSTVGEFLEKEGLSLKEGDTIFPNLETSIVPEMRIYVSRAHEISVKVDGEVKTFRTQARTVEEALFDKSIPLAEDDIVKPLRETALVPKMAIVITRVTVEERVVDKDIPFPKKVTEDDTLSWRKTVVTQKGVVGTERQTYRVSFHDGKEVNRKLLTTEVVKEPVTEVVTQGTEVKLGKSHTGAASWYAWTGTLAAANPWLPKGSYVKVTNVDNGKSVIVVINDRGPFVPGRIIDLDKVAFAKIASVGAGVINVKMEEIIN